MPIFQHWKTLFKKDSEDNLGFIPSEMRKNSPSDWNKCELNFLGETQATTYRLN